MDADLDLRSGPCSSRPTISLTKRTQNAARGSQIPRWSRWAWRRRSGASQSVVSAAAQAARVLQAPASIGGDLR